MASSMGSSMHLPGFQMGRDLRDAWGPIFETDVVFRVVSRPDVAKSRDPYSMWTGSVCGHAHAPSVAHATDVVIQVVSR